jgi:antitoxin (DNA-binding transcriptional repressor) of toxin-antitoxin stability system
MSTEISKTEFKAKALEVLRTVEDTGQSVIVTDRGVPTIEVRQYRGATRGLKKLLQGSVLSYDDPEGPTGEEWNALL